MAEGCIVCLEQMTGNNLLEKGMLLHNFHPSEIYTMQQELWSKVLMLCCFMFNKKRLNKISHVDEVMNIYCKRKSIVKGVQWCTEGNILPYLACRYMIVLAIIGRSLLYASFLTSNMIPYYGLEDNDPPVLWLQ